MAEITEEALARIERAFEQFLDDVFVPQQPASQRFDNLAFAFTCQWKPHPEISDAMVAVLKRRGCVVLAALVQGENVVLVHGIGLRRPPTHNNAVQNMAAAALAAEEERRQQRSANAEWRMLANACEPVCVESPRRVPEWSVEVELRRERGQKNPYIAEGMPHGVHVRVTAVSEEHGEVASDVDLWLDAGEARRIGLAFIACADAIDAAHKEEGIKPAEKDDAI